jgi:hypothetical protein
MDTNLDTYSTSLVIAICAVACAERVLVAYFTWKLAKRKGRLWLPYVLFGLLGLAVLALRSPTRSAWLAARPQRRTGFTHTGFSGPVADERLELPARGRRRPRPLADYHLPRGLVDQRAG